MGKVRHVDWYADEWISGTIGLGNAERGLYITAVCLIYSNGGPVHREDLRAACRDHGHAFNRQLQALLDAGKLTENDGQITNKRAINELQKAEERTAKSRQNGGKGGRPRKENNDIAKPDGFPNEKLTTNHQPPTTNQEEALGSVEPKGADAPPAQPNLVVVAGTEAGPKSTPSREPPDEKAELYGYGKQVLGKTAGGMITQLLKACEGNVETCRYNLSLAAKAQDPREYVGAILRGERTASEDWDVVYKRWGVQF